MGEGEIATSPDAVAASPTVDSPVSPAIAGETVYLVRTSCLLQHLAHTIRLHIAGSAGSRDAQVTPQILSS